MRLIYVVKPIKTNNVFYVNHAENLIFGRKEQINIIVNSTGSNYGLVRAILYGSSVLSLAIANQNYIASKTTGLSLHQKRILIFLNINILFMMGLISIRRGV